MTDDRILLEIADARTGRILRLRRGQITDSIGRQSEGFVIESDEIHEEAGFDAALAIAHALSLAGWADSVRRNWLGLAAPAPVVDDTPLPADRGLGRLTPRLERTQ